MSTEATENGKPAVVDEPGPAAAASDSTAAAEASATAEVTGSQLVPDPGDAPEPAEDSGNRKDPQDGGDFVDGQSHADDGTPDDGEVAADGEDDLGPYEEDEETEEDEDGEPGSGSLVELAEPVEFDDPVAAIRPVRRWPRVLLALGFVVLAAAIVGGAIAIVGSVTHGFKKPVKITYKKAAVFSLRTGDCFDPQGQSYTLVSCDSPHVGEVFATFTLAGEKWPGNSAVAAAASSGCATRLPGYLNPQLALALASTYVYPDATAWQAGTRTVICEVRAPSGDITGSVRGATASSG